MKGNISCASIFNVRILQRIKSARQDKSNEDNFGIYRSSLDGKNVSLSTVTQHISMVAVNVDRMGIIQSL